MHRARGPQECPAGRSDTQSINLKVALISAAPPDLNLANVEHTPDGLVHMVTSDPTPAVSFPAWKQ